ncbi:MAG TPA: hypothetical protein VFD39_09750 [Trueperaceae bacterium]|nr:hypothetical protein [Trueperaceae bacterium]
MTRLTEVNLELQRCQLQACFVACRARGEECRMHAAHMEHCRVCADACHDCERACDEMLALLAA